jgi:hypothetical protein
MSEQPLTVLGYMDVVLVVVAAPIMLLIGVPAGGYCIAGGTWIALRALGIAVERFAAATPEANRQIGVRMGYMLGRLFTLAIVVILVRKSDGQDAGLTALAVVVFAFTAQLVLSAFTRPRPSKGRPPAAPRTRPR